MFTVTFQVPPAMARDIAKATDILSMPSNNAFAFEATRLLLHSVLGSRRGRPYKQRALNARIPSTKGRRRP